MREVLTAETRALAEEFGVDPVELARRHASRRRLLAKIQAELEKHGEREFPAGLEPEVLIREDRDR